MKLGLFIGAFLSLSVCGTEILSEIPQATCEEFEFSKEVHFYKDPSLFLSNLALIAVAPRLGWNALMSESPLITTLKGRVHLMRLAPEREFKGFGAIARLYEWADPKFRTPSNKPGVKMVPIKVCGGGYDAYADTLGFVLAEDLVPTEFEVENPDGSLPPSTLGRPIPKWRGQSRKATPEAESKRVN